MHVGVCMKTHKDVLLIVVSAMWIIGYTCSLLYSSGFPKLFATSRHKSIIMK